MSTRNQKSQAAPSGRRRLPRIGIVLVAGIALACGKPKATSPTPAPSEATPGAGTADLRPEAELNAGCYGQPDAAWSRSNFAPYASSVSRGDRMWDFTLDDIDGRSHTLSDLLEDKPVLLLTGSYSCPVYRKNRAKIERLAGRYGNHLHVVVLHGPEAHPKSDPSPYKGTPWPKLDKFSHVELADTYEERVANARRVGGATGLTVLVEPLDNPVWCSIGPAPNGAWLVRQDGTFEAVHDWFDARTMLGSIDGLLGR